MVHRGGEGGDIGSKKHSIQNHIFPSCTGLLRGGLLKEFDWQGGDQGVKGEAAVSLVLAQGKDVLNAIHNPNVLAIWALGCTVELDKALGQGKESVVPTHTDILTRVEFSSSLPDDNVTWNDRVI